MKLEGDKLLNVSRNIWYKNKAGPFCSRKCRGSYGTDIQHKKRNKVESQVVNLPKYRRGVMVE